MKTVKWLLILFCISAAALAQGTWEWQNPLPQGDNLMDVFMLDADKAITVGVNGHIFMTLNAGLTWQVVPSGTREFLWSVFFIDDLNGWIAGEDNTVLSTADGGYTWEAQEPFVLPPFDPTNPLPPAIIIYNLNAIHFIDENTGWAVGMKTNIMTFEISGAVIHTTDGGDTWEDQEPGTDQCLYDVAAINSNKVFVVGGFYNEAILLETTDGGAQWKKRAGMPVYDGRLYMGLHGIEFPDANHGWIVGATDLILHTVNGGVSWTPVNGSSLPQYANLNDVVFNGSQNGWILGVCLLHTTNGGAQWILQDNPAPEVTAIHSPDGRHAMMAGPSGVLAGTEDGGDHWNLISRSVARGDLEDVHFLDEKTGYSCGVNGVILKTTDGGAEWTACPFTERDQNFLTCFFLNPDNGWVGGWGFSGAAWQAQLYYTPDGGITWLKKSQNWTGTVTGIHFVDPDTGWVVGESAMIRRTTDGGETWTLQANPYSGTVQQFEAVYFIDSQTGYIVAGSEGKILKTADGGDTWTEAISNTDKWLYDICFADDNKGWACGYGVIIHTTDGGATWTPQALPEESLDLDAIHFSDTQNGVALGKDAVKTSDGGITWTLEDPGVSTEFEAVWMAGKDQIWGVGENGMIMHWNSGEDTHSPPIITSPAEDLATEGELYTYTAAATDPDGDEITWNYISYPDWLTANGAVISGTPPARGRTESFTVTASDGQFADTLTITLTIEEASSVENSGLLPDEVVLCPNFPNPFNPSTLIRFGLSEKSHVRLLVYNTAGQCVAIMDKGIIEPGYHEVRWQASGFPSGVYTIRLETEGRVLTGKALLLK